MSTRRIDEYISLTVNGRLFPEWVLKNFKKYKLPNILRRENEDPCNVEVKLELRKYQEFVGQYLGPNSPYTSILLYHGLGSGKTATSINLMNILYNYDRNYNFIILIKASLHDDPWMKDLKIWLGRDPSEEHIDNVSKLAMFNTLYFVHYDSPFADKEFNDTMRTIDTTKPIAFFIDEAHNFIRNVYSNINSKHGKRAQVIYDFIKREKIENPGTRIVLISATPAINIPFELALMFNLLRPDTFPSSESDFNRMYITESAYPILNPTKRNMFERRILGLVSYYIGATPDLYARQVLKYVNLPMSEYQYEVYRVFEKIEDEIQKRARRYGKQSQLYRTYTRQACNFVFPNISSNVTGELRPRPGKFKISEKMADSLEKGKLKEMDVEEKEREYLQKYLKALDFFISEAEKYFQRIKEEDEKRDRTIFDDLEDFREGFETVYKRKFKKYYFSDAPKSRLVEEMYRCSPKMTAIAFMSYISPGKVMVYTNYVVMEGVDIMKIYYRLIGFNDFSIAKKFTGYCEYHGRIDPKERTRIKDMFNSLDNVYGEKCKVIILSPSATEGIQLLDIRQEHIMEPYWTEVRIQQIIGRGIRQCSHKDLPPDERVVDIYRYKVIKPRELDSDDTVRMTTDEYVEDVAKAKSNLIESFLSAMKEAAIDCELFRAHNMMAQSYHCFKFPEETLLGPHVGPAYLEDIKEDVKYDSGLHAKNSRVERIKVIKINAVYIIGKDSGGNDIYSEPNKYWYYSKTGMVYDYETHYPVGRVEFVNGLPNKLNKDTYIMSTIINIPTIGKVINP